MIISMVLSTPRGTAAASVRTGLGLAGRWRRGRRRGEGGGAAPGIGFPISSNAAVSIAEQLIANGNRATLIRISGKRSFSPAVRYMDTLALGLDCVCEGSARSRLRRAAERPFLLAAMPRIETQGARGRSSPSEKLLPERAGQPGFVLVRRPAVNVNEFGVDRRQRQRIEDGGRAIDIDASGEPGSE